MNPTTVTEVADSSKHNGQVCAAVRVNGEIRSAPTDLPADALFPIYSITKTLTAICVLRLVEMGSLRLGDPVRQWLPQVNVPATITLTHLLRHTSGLRDYGPLPEYHRAVRTHPDRPWTRQQFLDAVLPQGLLFAPGERFSYSNVGYMLLIDIVELVTGQTFARVLHDLVATPLALQRTSVLEDIDDLVRCVPGFGPEVTPDGHIVDVRGRYHPGWCAPRLVASTAEDITRVFDRLIAGDVLAADTLTRCSRWCHSLINQTSRLVVGWACTATTHRDGAETTTTAEVGPGTISARPCTQPRHSVVFRSRCS